LPPATVAFGELGLSGEVRPVAQRARRIAEARKLGFETIVAPPSNAKEQGDEATAVPDIARAIAAVLA
jgi:DNA repair protein RadA/Sms